MAKVEMRRRGRQFELRIEGEMPEENQPVELTDVPTEPLPSGMKATRSRDFASVNWFGRLYTFTPAQRDVVALLWDAWKNDTPFVSQASLLDCSDAERARLRDIFKNHPAFGTMIRQGIALGGPQGTYCLFEPKD